MEDAEKLKSTRCRRLSAEGWLIWLGIERLGMKKESPKAERNGYSPKCFSTMRYGRLTDALKTPDARINVLHS
jgi:hypothetical protein